MKRRFFTFSGIMLIQILLLTAVFSFLSATRQAAAQPTSTVRYVASDGNCGINTPCYAQVQAAVDAADSGDELRVAAGTYTGVSSRNGSDQFVYVDKTITLRGGYDPVTWALNPATNLTILDAETLGRVLNISGDIAPLIEYLHLTNGDGSDGGGGGVYIDGAGAKLHYCEIYSNTATYSGAGIYLNNSPATISKNQIYANITGSSGHGGGMTIKNSPADVRENTISNNQAHVGGGIELSNNVEDSAARVYSNTIQNNTAFDYDNGSYTFDGAGGGLNIGSGYSDTIKGNTISQNTAKWGGGIHVYGAPAIISENTIQENDAPTHGGGLYVQGAQPVIQHNDFLTNTAGNWGGGMTIIQTSNTTIGNNTFQGNTAGWRGGGVYMENGGNFDGNIFLSNTAVEQGGGMFSIRDDHGVHSNNVWKDNYAVEGGGIYLWGGDSSFVHNTIINNSSTDGRGIVIDKYPGLVNPSALEHTPVTVNFTNTILTDHSVGIFATEGNTLTVNSILWYNTPTTIQATGASMSVQNEFTGNPLFGPDGYHIHYNYSPAVDQGINVDMDHDLDGEFRPIPPGYDLGADEYMLSVDIPHDMGGSLVFGDPHDLITTTITVPPDVFTLPFKLKFSPFPPPPPAVNSFLGDFVPLGLPFRLTPFINGLPVPTMTLSKPITVTMTYQDQPDNFKPDTLDLFSILRNAADSYVTYEPRPAACEPARLGNSIESVYAKITGGASVPICAFGGAPSPVIPRPQVFQYQIDSLEEDGEFLYFLFLAEAKIVEYKTYLPLLIP